MPQSNQSLRNGSTSRSAWVVALVAWALVAILGILRVDVNSKVLAVKHVSCSQRKLAILNGPSC